MMSFLIVLDFASQSMFDVFPLVLFVLYQIINIYE
jgi:hypothetical protein